MRRVSVDDDDEEKEDEDDNNEEVEENGTECPKQWCCSQEKPTISSHGQLRYYSAELGEQISLASPTKGRASATVMCWEFFPNYSSGTSTPSARLISPDRCGGLDSVYSAAVTHFLSEVIEKYSFPELLQYNKRRASSFWRQPLTAAVDIRQQPG